MDPVKLRLLFLVLLFSYLFFILLVRRRQQSCTASEAAGGVMRSGNRTSSAVSSTSKLLGEGVDNYGSRNERVAATCAKYNLYRQAFNWTVLRRFYIWNPEFNLGYCLQSKTGTTTWMLNLLKISHLPKEVMLPKDKEHQVIKFLYALPLSLQTEELRLLLTRAFAFYFVRHPFERLVSAFRDKVINTDYNHWKDFRNTIKANESEPAIFQRFVDALLNDDFNIQWDIHNLPMYLKCDVCNIPYALVGKQETEREDNAFIISKLALTDVLRPELRVHANKDQTVMSAVELMSHLSRENVWKLFQHYRIDFEMFGYDPRPYLMMGKITK